MTTDNPSPTPPDCSFCDHPASDHARGQLRRTEPCEHPDCECGNYQPPTPPVETLSEEALAEIEAREFKYPYANTARSVVLTIYERDALCQSLRAAWAECEALEQFNVRLTTGLVNIYRVIKGAACKHGVALGMATSAVSSLKSENTALREQLAQAEKERDDYRNQLIQAKADS